MTATRSSEKRGDRRIPADLTLRAGGSAGAESFEMQVSNVSLGGAYCRSSRRFEPMTRIDVTMELPLDSGVQSIRTDAVVVRSDPASGAGEDGPFNLALWFQRMPAADREHLMRFLGTYEH